MTYSSASGLQHILPGKDPASSDKYPEEQTNSFRFAVWKIRGWPFSDFSIRVKLQQLPTQFKNIVPPKSFIPAKIPQLLSQLWPLQLLSRVSRWLSKCQLISPSTSPPSSTDCVPSSLVLLPKVVFPLEALCVPFLSPLENLALVPNPTQGPITASTLNAHSTYKCSWGFFLFWFHLLHLTLTYHSDIRFKTPNE